MGAGRGIRRKDTGEADGWKPIVVRINGKGRQGAICGGGIQVPYTIQSWSLEVERNRAEGCRSFFDSL